MLRIYTDLPTTRPSDVAFDPTIPPVSLEGIFTSAIPNESLTGGAELFDGHNRTSPPTASRSITCSEAM